jgi:hypothetical protein
LRPVSNLLILIDNRFQEKFRACLECFRIVLDKRAINPIVVFMAASDLKVLMGGRMVAGDAMQVMKSLGNGIDVAHSSG